MNAWTDIEFDRIAKDTKLSDRTLAACRDVLVGGVTGKDAAQTHGVLPPQISRALTILRDRREEFRLPTEKEAYDLKKALAMHAAREIAGGSIDIADPRPGGIYAGPIVLNAHGFVVQKTGRGKAVIHELEKLQDMAHVTGDVEIQYPASGVHTARVKDDAVAKDNKGVGR